MSSSLYKPGARRTGRMRKKILGHDCTSFDTFLDIGSALVIPPIVLGICNFVGAGSTFSLPRVPWQSSTRRGAELLLILSGVVENRRSHELSTPASDCHMLIFISTYRVKNISSTLTGGTKKGVFLVTKARGGNRSDRVCWYPGA